ncbi:SDR family oxidoreductase, partial [Klebsiella aerogenes]|uniref:SDR family oxidoreductase n=1 Tax=Klebsiella aerogenes TaxID=548 RepID=UPI001CBCDE25
VDAGAFCYVTGRNEDDGRRAQERLGENGRYVATDVTDENAVAGLFDLTESRHGRLDLAVNNAGVTTKRAAVRELDLKEWKRVL